MHGWPEICAVKSETKRIILLLFLCGFRGERERELLTQKLPSRNIIPRSITKAVLVSLLLTRTAFALYGG